MGSVMLEPRASGPVYSVIGARPIRIFAVFALVIAFAISFRVQVAAVFTTPPHGIVTE